MALRDLLNDLDDLDDDEEQQMGADGIADHAPTADDDMDAGPAEEKPAGLGAPQGLLSSARFRDLMHRIENEVPDGLPEGTPLTTTHPDYRTIIDCNELGVEVDEELEVLARHVRDAYAARFPELDSLVPNHLDYARVVQRIGAVEDLTSIELEGYLPAATVMVVTVTASTTMGKPLPPETLQRVLGYCADILALADHKAKMISFVEKRMDRFAPNLSAVVGPDIAAQLIGTAGGLTQLAGLPAGVVANLGIKRRANTGLASQRQIGHVGYILQSDLVKKSPPSLRVRVARLVSGRCTLAARVDGFRSATDAVDGSVGDKYREEILAKLAKWQEPAPFKVPKPLPIPEGKTTRKRGGARARAMKKRYEVTEMRVQANRMQFGVQEETFGLDEEGIGTLGMQQHTGKVRLVAKQQKTAYNSSKVKEARAAAAGGSGNTGGLSSSLAFTPVQGIELVNPTAGKDTNEGTETYFSRAAAFFTAPGGSGRAGGIGAGQGRQA